ncbi:MAG: flagellar biosynthesis anti-sigma factor FlgM [Endozoicomonas sp.]
MSIITDIQPLQTIRTTANKKAGSAKTSTESSVTVSDTSSLLARAEEVANQAPEVDDAKVEAIRQAIEDGELTIDYERLAQKMLEFELTLFDN